MPTFIKTAFLFFSAFAIGYAVWQSITLTKSLRTLQTLEQEERERVFKRRQHRRRIQISVLIGICGLCMFAGTHFSHETQPGLFALSWALAILFIFWTILLALVDALSIRMHFGRIHRRNLAEEAKYRYQLEQEMKKRKQTKDD
ncbi:MAG: hypothetical protein FWC43_05320 [Planctomycetaceae bacterium]|nr:hypothetical protein [Planctomycetaceae bacterium]